MFKKFIKFCTILVGASAFTASTQSIVTSGVKGGSGYFTGEVSVSMLFQSDTCRPFWRSFRLDLELRGK